MSIRILLADDHAMMRDGIKALFTGNAEMEIVAEAGNGRDALRRAEEIQPDVVIMDIAMPDLNGIEATRLLRARCPRTHIVVLSMHSSSEHVFRALQAGADGYLLKESAGTELELAVRTVHGGTRYLSRAIATIGTSVNDAQAGGPLDRLSSRERQVLQLVVEGYSSAAIALRIHLSPKSVETYRSRLMKKLGVSDIASLVKFAVQHGVTPPE